MVNCSLRLRTPAPCTVEERNVEFGLGIDGGKPTRPFWDVVSTEACRDGCNELQYWLAPVVVKTSVGSLRLRSILPTRDLDSSLCGAFV